MTSSWQTPANFPVLSTGVVHVWLLRLDRLSGDLRQLEAILTAGELARAEMYLVEAPRRRFVITRAVLRILLGHYLQRNVADVGIVSNPNTKPNLSADYRESNLHFNIAHSGDFALIAVTTDHELGIDIEVVRPVDHVASIAQRYFHPSEVLAIWATPPELRDAAFLRCWTGKEAVLKAIGTGITDSLATFAVPVDGREHVTLIDPVAPGDANRKVWLRRLDVGPSHVAALAIVDADLPVRCMEFTLLRCPA